MINPAEVNEEPASKLSPKPVNAYVDAVTLVEFRFQGCEIWDPSERENFNSI
jgi:hypothetical protein